MKVYRGSRGIAQIVLDLDTRWRLVLATRPGRFTSGEEPRYPSHEAKRRTSVIFTLQIILFYFSYVASPVRLFQVEICSY